jgi:hypothetical protein
MKMMSDDYAVYLPAVNEIYASSLIKPIPNNRPFPKSFELDDLAFWKKDTKLWHHAEYLHSIGQYSVGSTPDNVITRRGRTDGVLFGDSGGFQIGKGTLKGINGLNTGISAEDACDAWDNATDAKHWILGWLETYTNYAMTIDMPLWATLQENRSSPFHRCSVKQLTDMTVDNLHFIDRYRKNQTKWLNVLQGPDTAGVVDWWNAVKWFDCEGYALGGCAGYRGGLKSVLATVLMLRDDNAFRAGRDWIHALGVSTAKWAVVLAPVEN